jgi:hypothetical protein
MREMLQFVDHRHSKVLERDVTLAVCIYQELVAQAILARTLSELQIGGRFEELQSSSGSLRNCSNASIVASDPNLIQWGKFGSATTRTSHFTSRLPTPPTQSIRLMPACFTAAMSRESQEQDSYIRRLMRPHHE